MRLITLPAVLLAFGLAASHASAQTAPTFRFTEQAGPYAVGLRQVEQYDRARIFRNLTDDLSKPQHGERARPLQTLIWYPAQKGDGKPMTVRDYIELTATETSFGTPGHHHAHYDHRLGRGEYAGRRYLLSDRLRAKPAGYGYVKNRRGRL
ncbi:hypothetical protein [Dyella acidiphila]|uniref:Uncharacterized protein n=1 Tax=Dyella acidiphila TaxID=2775866 RepID=A0ABR9GA38_9GAMM|nr:hypothetical protein [Dyella acidiphila]MBE1160912.1 hypothetical protein [Dyella acidiphila]